MSIPQEITRHMQQQQTAPSLSEQGETARRRLVMLLDAAPAYLPSMGIPRALLPLAHTLINRAVGSLLTMESGKLILSLQSTLRMLRAVADSASTDEQFAEEVARVIAGEYDTIE